MSHSSSLLPARLRVGSQQSSSASSSAPRAPLRALMLLSPGRGASCSGLFPGPQPRRLRLRLAVLAGTRQRQPVPSVGAAAATLRREATRQLGALRESDAAGDPGSGAPFPSSPAASAVRALLRSCAIPTECAQRRSQRPHREVCPSRVRAPLRAPPLPAARRPRPPRRRPQCSAPRCARPRVGGPGRGLTRCEAGPGRRGRGHGAQ